jgi:hypothetical protein
VVTTNRKFPSPNGYSRQDGKRDMERLVAEDLEPEPPNRLPRPYGSSTVQGSHVALELGPRVMPRSGLDFRAVTVPAPWQKQLRLVLLRFGDWLLRLGKRLLRYARRQGERLFHWVAWK